MTRRAFICIAIIIFAFAKIEASTATGCNRENSANFVVQDDDTLSIYALNAARELEQIWILPTQFHPFRYSQNNEVEDTVWFIPHVNDIVPSPDGCHIAFVAARNPERGFSNRQLFIHPIANGDVKQLNLVPEIDIESPNLLWSPDSTTLAIATDEGNIYIYKVADESLTRFARTETHPSFLHFQWIENEYIAFVRTESANNSSGMSIYLRSLDGQVRRDLTLFEEMKMPSLLTWNAASQRLFYVTGGLSENNQVFSVDLEGNNRLELDLAEFYPSETITRVMGLVVEKISGDVYVFTKQIAAVNDLERIFRITSEGDVSVFMESPSVASYAVLPPTGDTFTILFVVTAMERQIQLITLSSAGTITELSGNLCNFIYVDDVHVAYMESETFCWNGDGGNRDLFVYDVSIGDVINLTSEIAHPVWILPYQNPGISWQAEQMTWMLEVE